MKEELKVYHHISFKVKSDLNYLKDVLSQFESLKQGWISEKDWLQCQLALAEGFTNAVRHAHKNRPPETLIEINITVGEEEIKIQIWDYGQPFQLESIQEKISQPQELATGGRGIEILQKIADNLSYDRTPDNRNRLMIRKKLTMDNKQLTNEQ